MSIDLPSGIEEQLRALAAQQGRNLLDVVEEAIPRQRVDGHLVVQRRDIRTRPGQEVRVEQREFRRVRGRLGGHRRRFREALRRDVPILAICRGQQVLNVATGGTLVQDIPSEWPGAGAHDDDGPRWRRSGRGRRIYETPLQRKPRMEADVARHRRRAVVRRWSTTRRRRRWKWRTSATPSPGRRRPRCAT